MAAHEDQNASDLELVRRIKRGDEQAFREMVERYHARVYSLVLRRPPQRRGRGRGDAGRLPDPLPQDRDLRRVEEVLLLVLPRGVECRPTARPPAQARRHRLPGRLPARGSGEDGHAASPEFAALGRGRRGRGHRPRPRRARRGIHRRAPRPYRDAIWMVDVEEMKPADVAEILEISLAGPQVAPAPGAPVRAPAAARDRRRAARGAARERRVGAMTPRRDDLPAADSRVPRRVRGRLDARGRAARAREALRRTARRASSSSRAIAPRAGRCGC